MRKIALIVLVLLALSGVACSKDEAAKGPDYCTQERTVHAKFVAFNSTLAAQFTTPNAATLRTATTELQTEVTKVIPLVPAELKADYNGLAQFLSAISLQLGQIDFDLSKAPAALTAQLRAGLPAALKAAQGRIQSYDKATCGIQPTP